MDFVPATKFGYAVPSAGRFVCCCRVCVYTKSSDGHRHWGMVMARSFESANFGRLILYCSKQEAHVMPEASCAEFCKQR